VEDDGVGISPESLGQSQSLGLLGMRERAAIFGGQVEIAGIPGKGTTVYAASCGEGEGDAPALANYESLYIQGPVLSSIGLLCVCQFNELIQGRRGADADPAVL
jgi:hypothetical protein